MNWRLTFLTLIVGYSYFRLMREVSDRVVERNEDPHYYTWSPIIPAACWLLEACCVNRFLKSRALSYVTF